MVKPGNIYAEHKLEILWLNCDKAKKEEQK